MIRGRQQGSKDRNDTTIRSESTLSTPRNFNRTRPEVLMEVEWTFTPPALLPRYLLHP